jgi:hypothetical protein
MVGLMSTPNTHAPKTPTIQPTNPTKNQATETHHVEALVRSRHRLGGALPERRARRARPRAAGRAPRRALAAPVIDVVLGAGEVEGAEVGGDGLFWVGRGGGAGR